MELSTIYTYRNGKKVYLKKIADEFVARMNPEELAKMDGVEGVEQVSSSSTRVKVKAGQVDKLMQEVRKKAVAHHAYVIEDNGSEFLITDRILITFKEGITNEKVTVFMAKYALKLMEKYSDREYLFQLTDETGINPVKLVVAIIEKEKDIVESCEHDLNKRMQRSNVNVPADAKYMQQWHLHSHFVHPNFDQRSSSNCEGAWNLLNNFGSPDVVIGITDDGCKIDHSDFDSVGKFASWGYLSGTTLVTRDDATANPAGMYQSGADHGTCCCGVIAAEVDGTLAVGAAPACKLLPIKWESDDGGLYISDSKMIKVLDFVSSRVDVLSNSWGSSPDENWSTNIVNRIKQMAIIGGRRGKGIVFLWAAGNENCPVNFTADQNVPYTDGYQQKSDGSYTWVGVKKSKTFEHNLADVPGVIYVAALASNAQRSHYSNYGKGISLCAPSSNSHEYWRMVVTGLGITTTSGRSPFFDTSFGGTSSATPLVAGIAGLVISANPALSALEVISVMQKTAGKDLNMTGYSKTPPASYDPDTSWDISPVTPFNTGVFSSIGHPDGTWSGWFGFGKIDATAAVAEALRLAGGAVANNPVTLFTSSPAKPIPDNNATGITDVIAVNAGGSIASIKIDLDITHSYIGDLTVKITSPVGTSIILHNRNGGSTKNINKTYDVQNTPQLVSLNGESTDGNWTLVISDIAAVDTGVLNKWTLGIGVAQAQAVTLVDNPGVTIPDNNPAGIERSLVANGGSMIKEAEIGIDITHTYISDLIVNLVSPQGTVVSLHSRTGGSADNIITTYTFANNPGLQVLKGKAMQGTWKLKVSDVVGQDVGKLNKWSLKFVKQ